MATSEGLKPCPDCAGQETTTANANEYLICDKHVDEIMRQVSARVAYLPVTLAANLFEVARHIGNTKGADPLDMAVALGQAMTRMLHFTMGGNPHLCLASAKIMADASLKSMADILSGSDAENQTTQ